MKCYCGTIITVNANDDVVRYLVEDKGKIIYVGNELPKQYQNAEIIDLKEKALIPAFRTRTSILLLFLPSIAA